MVPPSENPYYIADEDDDILKPHKRQSPSGVSGDRKHTLDGSMCNCGVEHKLKLPQDIPSEVLDQLSDFLDKLPHQAIDIIVTAENSMAMQLLYDFTEFAEEVDTANPYGPILRAIAESVDSLMGENKLGSLIKFYESEQLLITTHVVVRSLNTLKKTLLSKLENENDLLTSPILEALDSIIYSSSERMAIAIEHYINIAKETGNRIDESIIEKGKFSDDASYFASRLGSIPIFKFSMGDEEDGNATS